MRYRVLILHLFAIFLIWSCGGKNEQILTKDTEIQGYLFKGGTEVSFYPSRKVKSGWLAKKIEINQISLYPADQITLYETGEIKEAFIFTTNTVNGLRLIPGSTIGFDRKGTVEWVRIAEEMEILSNIVPSNTIVGFKEYEHVIPNEDTNADPKIEKVSAVYYLQAPTELNIGRFYFMANTPIYFRKNGDLIGGSLARETLMYQIKFPAGSRFAMDAAGNAEIVIGAPTKVRGATIAAGSKVAFNLFAKVRYIMVSNDDAILDGKLQKDISLLYFSEEANTELEY